MSIVDTPEYKSGANIEMRVASLLAARGYSINRVRNGGMVVPALQAWESDLQARGGTDVTLPDLQVFSPRGDHYWLEVKSKTNAAHYRNANEWRTGIDLRLHHHYLRVREVTGRPVFLLFCHRQENQVRVTSAERDYIRGSGQGAGMVYWVWERLELLTMFDALMERPARQLQLGPLFQPDVEHIQMALGDQ